MKLRFLQIFILCLALVSCKPKTNSVETKKTDSSTTSKPAQDDKTLTTGTGNDGGTTAASTWTDAERETFVSTCTNSAASLGARARPYCECSLEKLEKIYPNSADVSKLSDAQTEAIAKECLKQ